MTLEEIFKDKSPSDWPKVKRPCCDEIRVKIDGSSWNPGQTLDDIERAVILQALQFHSGNRTHTAKALGISIRTLRNKLAEYRKHGIFA